MLAKNIKILLFASFIALSTMMSGSAYAGFTTYSCKLNIEPGRIIPHELSITFSDADVISFKDDVGFEFFDYNGFSIQTLRFNSSFKEISFKDTLEFDNGVPFEVKHKITILPKKNNKIIYSLTSKKLASETARGECTSEDGFSDIQVANFSEQDNAEIPDTFSIDFVRTTVISHQNKQEIYIVLNYEIPKDIHPSKIMFGADPLGCPYPDFFQNQPNSLRAHKGQVTVINSHSGVECSITAFKLYAFSPANGVDIFKNTVKVPEILIGK